MNKYLNKITVGSLYAIFVVSGLLISLVTSLVLINPKNEESLKKLQLEANENQVKLAAVYLQTYI